VAELLQAAVFLVAAGEPVRRGGRASRWWPAPLAVLLALASEELADALDVSHPSARIAAGLVVAACAVWALTAGADRPTPVAAVAATSLGLALDVGQAEVVVGALLAGAVLVALPQGSARSTLAQLLAVVLAVGGVGLTVAGIEAV
jgi:hypothetical protein